MTANHNVLEAHAFNELTVEVTDAVKSQDETTARDALSELEGMWMHTDCPDMRSSIADFMGRHAAYGEFTKFSA